jgi:putative endonuclease
LHRLYDAETVEPCVYILANRPNGTLYVGVTSDVKRRIWQYRSAVVEGFAKQYGVYILVYVESHAPMEQAILPEKRVKKWRRGWKLKLIEEANPTWRDLYDEL